MTASRSGAGDPARTLALLWRSAAVPQRGPRRGLSVDAVVDGAVALADRHGLDAVTMRRLAQELGVGPMTLYTYVPGREELLDLMLDAVYARMERRDLSGETWRRRVETVAAANRALFAEHPWAAAVSTARPPLGPGVMAKYEHELSAFDGLALTDVEMDTALSGVLGLVRVAALERSDAGVAARDTAMSDAQWWEANAPLLERVMDASTFPLAARVGTAAGEAHGTAYDADHVFTWSLQRLLDGIEALIEGRTR